MAGNENIYSFATKKEEIRDKNLYLLYKFIVFDIKIVSVRTNRGLFQSCIEIDDFFDSPPTLSIIYIENVSKSNSSYASKYVSF